MFVQRTRVDRESKEKENELFEVDDFFLDSLVNIFGFNFWLRCFFLSSTRISLLIQ